MGQKKTKRVTLQQVAEHAGVSRATASLIVRNSPKVSAATREKVLQSMEELGYVYDRIAASLRSQSSTTVGLIITDISNTFFSGLLKGVHLKLEESGFTVLLGTTFDSIERQQKILASMIENRVAGIVVCPVSGSGEETIKQLNQINIPLVMAVRELQGVACDYVGINYEKGVNLAVQHLLQKGHERIALIGGKEVSTTWNERKAGYLSALKNHGYAHDPSLLITSDPTIEGGNQALKSLMKRESVPTAAVCFNDLVAFGVMQGIRELDLIPGKDLELIGFDNVPESALVSPALTTVSSFAMQTGETAAELLQQRIEHTQSDQKRVILEPELIKRDSS